MRQFLSRHIYLLLSLIVVLFVSRTLFTTGHYPSHDDLQVFRTNDYISCFQDGQIPCRWSSDLGKGYGYPWFNYYPPMIYTLAGVVHLLGFPITGSLNILNILSALMAGTGMYYLAHSLTGRKSIGFIASSLYSLYPFHAVNIFIRNVYAENLSWSITPWILLLVYNQVKNNRPSRLLPLLLAIVYLTHILSAFIVTGIILYWVFFVSLHERQGICKNFTRLLISIFLGLGISAFFFFPAIIEKNLVQVDSLKFGYYSYYNHFVSLGQLFLDYKWNYGSSLWGALQAEMPFMLGQVHLLTLTVLLLSSCLWGYKNKSKIKIKFPSLAISLVVLFIFFIFLTHLKSQPIWELVTPLQFIQFPWRFISWAGIPLILSIVVLLGKLGEKTLRILSIIIPLAAFIYSARFFTPREFDGVTDQDIILGDYKLRQQEQSLYDYLPKTVKVVPERFATSPLYESSEITTRDYLRTSNQLSLTVSTSHDIQLIFSVFYFPGWQGHIDEKPVDIKPSDPNGLIELTVPAGESRVDLEFRETPTRRFIDYLSLFSIVLYLVYLYRGNTIIMYNSSHDKK